MISRALVVLLLSLAFGVDAEPMLKLVQGDRIAIFGNGFSARMRDHGFFESEIHTRFAEHRIKVRNFSWAGEEPLHRHRPHRYDPYGRRIVDAFKPNVFILFFGMNASFRAERGLKEFRDHYHKRIHDLRNRKYAANQRFVLVSPIAQPYDLAGDLSERNKRLLEYSEMVRRVAGEFRIPYVDLYTPSLSWYTKSDARSFSFNGIHLTEKGYRLAAAELASQLFGKGEKPYDEPLLKEVRHKSRLFHHRYLPLNGWYVYSDGKRHYGDKEFKAEAKKLDEILAIHDGRIWRLAAGESVEEPADYSKTTALPEPTGTGPTAVLSPEQSRDSFEVPKGYRVQAFASEAQFPELRNPSSMVFDGEGRLWVTTMPGYPQYLPGSTFGGKILVLEDTDNNGRADTAIVFADGLFQPLSLELGHGGVYVAQTADVLFLKDTDGDGTADERTILLQGFGTEDTAVTNNTFVWGPDGALYFQHGNWIRSQVETPYGVRRFEHSTIVRFDPASHRVEAHARIDVVNLWGHIFDRWGQNIVAEPTHARVFHVTPVSSRLKFPERHVMQQELFKQQDRPISALAMVASSQFPFDTQGRLLVGNCLGESKIRLHELEEDGSTFKRTSESDFIKTKDKNYKPIALRFGPDGALYILDWCNPIIGHSQYSFRQPHRDHSHGRIWRVTNAMKRLLPKFQVSGAPIPDLLNQLRLWEDEGRYRARRELDSRPTAQVLAALGPWMDTLNPDAPDYERSMLEGLWAFQRSGKPNASLLSKLLHATDYRVRAAATRVLGAWRSEVTDAVGLLKRQANDPHLRVRLEAVIAASHYRTHEGAEIALEVLRHHRDHALGHAFNEVMRTAEPYIKQAIAKGIPVCAENAVGMQYILGRVNEKELAQLPRIREVCVALLARDKVATEHRLDALKKLAAFDKKSTVQVLLDQFRAAPKAEKERLESLCSLLPTFPASELTKESTELVRLAREFPRAAVRESALAALIVSAGDADRTEEKFFNDETGLVQNAKGLADLLNATRWLKVPEALRSMHPRIRQLLVEIPESIQAESTVIQGRYVRIDLPRRGTLTLAEVEIFSRGLNIAHHGTATQSGNDHGGVPIRAIDGRTDGIYGHKTSTHTPDMENPWWEVDLGATYPIDTVTVWNRTEQGLGSRLENFRLTILERDRKQVFVRENNPAPAVKATLQIGFDPQSLITAAAANALLRLPISDAMKIADLTKSIAAGRLAIGAETLLRMDAKSITGSAAKKLSEATIEQLKKVGDDERKGLNYSNGIRLLVQLVERVPEPDREGVRAALKDLGWKSR